MSIERVKDIIDWRGEKGQEIKQVFKELRFNFALVSDQEYTLGPYEIIRLANIIATSRRMKRSLEAFERFIRKKERMYGMPEWGKRGR
ncbi:hypothetical protein ES705_47266 [subsurface metagenome]